MRNCNTTVANQYYAKRFCGPEEDFCSMCLKTGHKMKKEKPQFEIPLEDQKEYNRKLKYKDPSVLYCEQCKKYRNRDLNAACGIFKKNTSSQTHSSSQQQ